MIREALGRVWWPAYVRRAWYWPSMAIARGADTGVTIKGRTATSTARSSARGASARSAARSSVYKQKGRKQKPSVDKKIGSDISERSGNVGVYSLGNTGFKTGKFYAKAPQTARLRRRVQRHDPSSSRRTERCVVERARVAAAPATRLRRPPSAACSVTSRALSSAW